MNAEHCVVPHASRRRRSPDPPSAAKVASPESLICGLNPLAAFLITLGSIAGALLAILSARLVAEFVLITFRINDHLGTLRSRTEM